jgi:hypothetical protein
MPTCLAQRLQRVAADVAAVDEYRAIEDVVQAENQRQDRRLAGAGRSDQRRPLAGSMASVTSRSTRSWLL